MPAKLNKISTKMLAIKNSKVAIHEIYDDTWMQKNITLSLLRLDMIDPVISGNKMFKLFYFLQKAIELKLKIITFGGTHSNHLAATAAACKLCGLACVGIVRGEKPPMLPATLLYCSQQGMQLEFISRDAYRRKQENAFQQNLKLKFGSHILIPEGGFSEEGVRGAAEIHEYIANKDYTHICCSVGTATTIAALIQAAHPLEEVIGFSALKELDFEERINYLLKDPLSKRYRLVKEYHFGGYAKKSDCLIGFMNTFYKNHGIPLDFVYTGKMMFGVIDMIRQNYFAEKSRIICIHTGGLQGNSSLMPGELKY